MRDVVLERESAPERVCNVLESEKDGTEGVGSAFEEQNLLLFGLRYIRGNEMIVRSNSLSTYGACWEGG